MSVLGGDTLVDTNGVLLPAHTPTGANPATSWARSPLAAGDIQIQGNGIAGTTTLGFIDVHAVLNLPATTPADVSIAFDFVTETNVNHFPAVTARHSATTDACIYAQYDRGVGQWDIGLVSGANPGVFAAPLASGAAAVPANGTRWNMVFEVQGTAIRLKLNGSLLCSATDSTISAAGKVGVYDVTGTLLTATTGFHIENVVVSDIAAGSPPIPHDLAHSQQHQSMVAQ